MNNTPLNLGVSRYGCNSRSSGSAIQSVLAANIGKTVTIFTTGCEEDRGFTGLLTSVGDGVCTLVGPESRGGCRNGSRNGCPGGCPGGSVNGCPGGCRGNFNGCGPNLSTLTAARLCALNNVSTVIPINQICAVSLPNF